jgi:glycosyltransferase involved in cell wall biosynthesis
VEPHPNLDLLGTIRNVETMKDLYRNASVFVLPHRFDRSPHVLVEAMSAGKPIITSNQGGAPEVIKHGVSGYLIDVGDVKSLAYYIVSLIKNKEMRRSFGETGKKIMNRDHTWETITSKMLNIIDNTRYLQ